MVNLRQVFFEHQPILEQSDASNNPWSLLSIVLPNLFILSAVILFFLAVAAGFMITTSSGNPEQAQKGKQVATFAIIGFVIIFTSYWLMQIISYLTGYPLLGGPSLP